MLTYALGRGLEYYDVQAVDEIVARLEAGGRPAVGAAGGHHRVGPVPEAPRPSRVKHRAGETTDPSDAERP